MNDLRRFLGYFRRYQWHVALASVCVVLVGALGLLLPWSIELLVDDVIAGKNRQLLNRIPLLFLGLVVVQGLFQVAQIYLLSYIGEHVVADLRSGLCRKLHQLDVSFFEERRVGEITSRVTNDVSAIQSLATSQMSSFLLHLLTLCGGLALIVYSNPRLSAVMLGVVPPIILASRVFGTLLRRNSTRVQDHLANATGVLEETLSGVRIVKSFVREEHEISRFKAAVNTTLAAAMRKARFRAGFAPLVTFCTYGGLALVIWFGGRQVLAGDITAGSLVRFIFYTFMIAGSMNIFAGIYGQFQESMGALHRVFELLDTPPAVVDAAAAIALPRVQGAVRFDGVSFAYKRDSVLRDIDLDVAPGEVIALVGPSGAGKSTIFNLLLRFYDPSHGRILVDGLDLKDVTAASLREQVSVVPQETVLFSVTVRENIRYGRLDAGDDEIVAAAQAANAHDFIVALPEGYDTRVGERGVTLSGGERQRVAIARAFLKNPRILLLDEATSALDSESEGLVQDALARLMQGQTTFIIAHRLATVQIADRIVVLDKGRVVDVGSHEELLARDGLYAHLYGLQFRDGSAKVQELEERSKSLSLAAFAEKPECGPFPDGDNLLPSL